MVDHECRDGAVWLLFRGNRGEADHDVRLLHDVLEQGGGVVRFWRIAFKQLARGEHHLVGRLAPSAAATHAIGHHAQYASIETRVRQQGDLVLLVLAVTLVDAGRRNEAERFGHGIGAEDERPPRSRESGGAAYYDQLPGLVIAGASACVFRASRPVQGHSFLTLLLAHGACP